jgi:hypothetical protein
MISRREMAAIGRKFSEPPEPVGRTNLLKLKERPAHQRRARGERPKTLLLSQLGAKIVSDSAVFTV